MIFVSFLVTVPSLLFWPRNEEGWRRGRWRKRGLKPSGSVSTQGQSSHDNTLDHTHLGLAQDLVLDALDADYGLESTLALFNTYIWMGEKSSKLKRSSLS